MRAPAGALVPAFALSFALSLALAAGGARAADFTLDDIAVAAGPTTFRAARVEVSGSALDREAALALLSPGDPRPLTDRLAAIDARRIAIPELVARTEVGGVAQEIVYRDLALEDVARGQAATLRASAARFSSRRAGREETGACGAIGATGLDLVAIARLMAEGRTDGQTAPQTKAREFTISDCAVDLADGLRVAIGRTHGRDMGGRPLLAPVASLTQPGPGAPSPDNPATRRAVALLAADVIDSMAFGAVEFTDVRATRGAEVNLAINRAAFENLKDSRIGAITLEGLAANTADGPVSLGKATLAGLDAKPMFAAAIAEPARRAMPRFDSLEAERLAANGLTVGRLRIDAGQWTDLMPTRLDIQAERATIEPARLGMPGLAALGYAMFEARGAFRMRYDAGRRVLSFEEISGEAPGLGHARLSAEFAKVQPELFSGDAETLKSALPSVFFSSAAMRLDDLGLFGRISARPDGPSRAMLADTARLVARGVLGDGPAAAPAIDAIGRFFGAGKSLDMRMEAPQPLGLIDLMMAGRLSGLADRLKVEAKAE